MEGNSSGGNYTPRPYQIDIYKQAVERNSIIYLPTGSGKTFIAVLIIKHYKDQLLKPYNEDGKKAIFIVNTVPLVIQQTEYLAYHTGLSTKGYSGNDEVEQWSHAKWNNEFLLHQILVITPQILLSLLNKGVMSMEKCSVIFFDECHRAVEDHPMRLIAKQLTDLPVEKQPRIVGLSGTLLNSNVPLSSIEHKLCILESTFNAKILTINDKNEVKDFSTAPTESMIIYDSIKPTRVTNEIKRYFDEIEHILTNVQLENNVNKSSKEFQSQSINSKLINMIEDIKEQFNELGLYGGDKAIITHLLEIQNAAKYINDSNILFIYKYIITKLITIRAMIEQEMKNLPESNRIFNYSSNKVLNLIQVIKNFNTQKSENQQLCCIIFVQRKFTAKVLYDVLKILSDNVEDFGFLKPGFIVSEQSQAFKSERIDISMANRNKNEIRKFRDGSINCIVSTDLIDEGIDIPICTLVIRFYFPQDFRAYAQSKGRARYSSSQYKIFIEESKADVLYKRYSNYRSTGKTLDQILIIQKDERKTVKNVDLSEELTDRYSVFDSKSGITTHVDEHSAISLIHKYCSALYKSSIVQLHPVWKSHSKSISKEKTCFQVSLELPLISPLREVVFGKPKSTIEAAKRSAAFETCVKLHKMGELTDRLQPNCDKNIPPCLVDKLLPNWVDEKLEEENPKRMHAVESIECFYNAYPEQNKKCYIHIIETTPTNKTYSSQMLPYYNILRQNNGFGILSTKEMPMIPDFPIFMHKVELSVKIHNNKTSLFLSTEEIEKLRLFHTFVFSEITSVIKDFMVFNKSHSENNFLIVPIDSQWNIDWPLVNSKLKLHYTDLEPSNINYSDLEFSLIKSKHACSNELYFVTKVRHDLSLFSKFPNNEYTTFYNYFEKKHNLLAENHTQPLLEVNRLKTNIDFHKPCEKMEKNHVEILVPEFCKKLEFPKSYFIKALLLPTIFYRLSHLLICEQLRTVIVKDMNIGLTKMNVIHKWQPLKVDKFIDSDDDSSSTVSLEEEFQERLAICSSQAEDQEMPLHDEMVSNLKNHEVKIQNNELRTVNKTVLVPPLQFDIDNRFGPELATISAALTTAQADDIVNLERFETLGDAFLKFAVSLYLFQEFQDYNQGMLSQIKTRMIDNRNLYYCGKTKAIPGKIRDQPFNNEIAPSFSICRNLQNLMIDKKISPNYLHEINVTPEERLKGCMDHENYLKIEQTLSKFSNNDHNTNMEHYLSLQYMNDKTTSDAVEALIGVYLQECGVESAFKLLQWFQILPPIQIKDLLSNEKNKLQMNQAEFQDSITIATIIEKNIGYKFKNNAYLLEALTHPTWMDTKTKCYERLEFLGDSVLDILITKYIFEKCSNLTPGELTDVRSALTNNVIFACLTVKYGLHKYLRYVSTNLKNLIDKFVDFQVKRNHKIDTNILEILYEKDYNLAEYIEPPKVLGDIFESVIAAIYLDCNKNLSIVWDVVYKLMHEEIENYVINTPKQAMRDFFEHINFQPSFSKPQIVEGTNTVSVTASIIYQNQRITFNGFGKNNRQAKCAAAHHALNYIKRLQEQ